MTISTTIVKSGPYAGTGATDTYAYDFRVQLESEIVVTETDNLGNASVLVLDTHYSVTGVNDQAGGTCVRTDGNLPSGYTWLIQRSTALTQSADFPGQGAFVPQAHEDAIDKLMAIAQEIADDALSRYGTNIVLGDIDFGGFRLTNLPDAIDSSEPVTLGQYTTFAGSPVSTAANEVITGQWTLPENTIVLDSNGNPRRIAYRRNYGRYVSGSTSLLQTDDDGFIEYNGAGGDNLTLLDPALPGTTVTVKNVGSGPLNIVEDTGNALQWLNGSSVLTGNRVLAVGGVMTLKYESVVVTGTTSLVDSWGLGVT